MLMPARNDAQKVHHNAIAWSADDTNRLPLANEISQAITTNWANCRISIT